MEGIASSRKSDPMRMEDRKRLAREFLADGLSEEEVVQRLVDMGDDEYLAEVGVFLAQKDRHNARFTPDEKNVIHGLYGLRLNDVIARALGRQLWAVCRAASRMEANWAVCPQCGGKMEYYGLATCEKWRGGYAVHWTIRCTECAKLRTYTLWWTEE